MWSKIVKADDPTVKQESHAITPWIRRTPSHDAAPTSGAATPHNGPDGSSAIFDAADIMRRASQRAADLLRAARHEAEQHLVAAADEIERRASEAERRGYEAGYEEGVKVGRKDAEAQVRDEMRALLDSLNGAMREIEEERKRLLTEAADDAVKFAVLIAEKIVRQSLQQPEATAHLAGALLQDLRDESRVTIHLPPPVLEHPETESFIAQGAGDSGVRWSLAADPSLGLGDVRIETEWGWVDGRGAVRWARLIRALEEAMHRGTGSASTE